MTTTTRVIEMPPCSFEDFLIHMDQNGGGEHVWSWVEMCARTGVFYSDPENTILARPVDASLPEEEITAFMDLPPGKSNLDPAWLIMYAKGSPELFFELAPYPLPKLIFHRNKGSERRRTYDFFKIKNRILSHGK